MLDFMKVRRVESGAHRHFAAIAIEGNSHVDCARLRYVVKSLTQFMLTCNYA
uniref:HDC09405 n=1 Tax=Drosophila melanogaster TaxID=7227 RepID=Q6ILI3_DROME|nr:TPA_inf: HDC09405 [Drosophila melanogaster]